MGVPDWTNRDAYAWTERLLFGGKVAFARQVAAIPGTECSSSWLYADASRLSKSVILVFGGISSAMRTFVGKDEVQSFVGKPQCSFQVAVEGLLRPLWLFDGIDAENTNADFMFGRKFAHCRQYAHVDPELCFVIGREFV